MGRDPEQPRGDQQRHPAGSVSAAQRVVRSAANSCVPVGPQGRHADGCGAGGGAIRRAERHAGREVQADSGKCRNRGGHEYRGQTGQLANVAACLCGRDRSFIRDFPVLAGGDLHGASARSDVVALRGAHGHAGNRHQGRYAAGDRIGCWHRRGLFVVRSQRDADAPASGA
ncbi:hypothetical protein D9M68_670040 [compost metagenome]